jgi:uncharacterized OsmC-like protein
MTTESGAANSEAELKHYPLVIPADVQITGYRKAKAEVREHVIYTGESSAIGGDGSAPSPLQYFVSSVVF